MDDGELCMNATGLNSGLLALRELRAGFEIGVTGISCAFIRCGGVHCDFLTCSSTCSVAEVATFLMWGGVHLALLACWVAIAFKICEALDV